MSSITKVYSECGKQDTVEDKPCPDKATNNRRMLPWLI